MKYVLLAMTTTLAAAYLQLFCTRQHSISETRNFVMEKVCSPPPLSLTITFLSFLKNASSFLTVHNFHKWTKRTFFLYQEFHSVCSSNSIFISTASVSKVLLRLKAKETVLRAFDKSLLLHFFCVAVNLKILRMMQLCNLL